MKYDNKYPQDYVEIQQNKMVKYRFIIFLVIGIFLLLGNMGTLVVFQIIPATPPPFSDKFFDVFIHMMFSKMPLFALFMVFMGASYILAAFQIKARKKAGIYILNFFFALITIGFIALFILFFYQIFVNSEPFFIILFPLLVFGQVYAIILGLFIYSNHSDFRSLLN